MREQNECCAVVGMYADDNCLGKKMEKKLDREIDDAASGIGQSQATQFNVTGSSGTFIPAAGLGNDVFIQKEKVTPSMLHHENT